MSDTKLDEYHLKQCPFCKIDLATDKEDIEQLSKRFIPIGITTLRFSIAEDYLCMNCRNACQFVYEVNTLTTDCNSDIKIVAKKGSRQEKLKI